MQPLIRPLFPILLAVCAPAAQASESDVLSGLAWMTGHWGSQQDGAWVEEHWIRPRGGIMLGANRSGERNATKAFEFLWIAVDADGKPVYWAAPSGRAATPFKLVAVGPDSATFENLTNAYPKRISYHRSGDTMTAAIEGVNGSQRMSWTWRRLPVRR